MGQKCETCVCAGVRRRVNISRDIGSTVGKPRDPSASIVTLPTQNKAWAGAKVPARQSAKHPAVYSRPPFSSASLFPLCPRLTLFCSLSFLPTPFLLLPVCYSSSFLTSRLPALCHRFWLRSVVRHVSPVRRIWSLIFRSPEEISEVKPSFKYFS